MKKLLALILACILSFGVLTACGDDPIDENADQVLGLDAVRLLLAGERLDSELLKNNEDIFGNGADDLRSLAYIAQENLSAKLEPISLSADGNISPLSSAGTRYPLGDGSYAVVDGNTYSWHNFSETSNSYEYFSNITGNVIFSAELGAQLIDHVKKNVRVVDKWVDFYGMQYYLHVEANSELLLCRDINNNMLQACARTKNAAGSTVYEVYNASATHESRMVYIPGELCEYAHQSLDVMFNHNFLATNTKGYWEVVDVNKVEEGRFNVSCMVLKDGCCFDAFYEPSTQQISMIKVLSADKNTDLFFYSDGYEYATVDLCLQGYNGVDRVEITTDDPSLIFTENFDGGKIFSAYHTLNPTVFTESGKSITVGETYMDGAVRVYTGYVTHCWYSDACSYIPTIGLLIKDGGVEANMQTLAAFLAEMGLECRRDFNAAAETLAAAKTELAQFTKYQLWNESNITTVEDLNQGFVNREAKFASWRDSFESASDAEIISSADAEKLELNAYLAEVSSDANATAHGTKITIESITLSVSDTLLFVVGEKYSVGVALLGDDGTLTHVARSEQSTEFTDTADFGVSCTDLEFDLPRLSDGEYLLVGFITTSDGIRSTDYIPILFGSVLSGNDTDVAKLTKHIDNSLKVSYSNGSNVKVSLSLGDECGYADMYEALCASAYTYGFVENGASVEMLNADGTWSALNGDETALASGVYRLAYSVRNGSSVIEGAVYTEYTAG